MIENILGVNGAQSSSQDVEGFCIIHLICMGCWPDFIQLYDHFTHEKGVKPNFSFLYFCERVITVSVEFMTAQSGHFCQRPSALKDHHILCRHSLFNMTNWPVTREQPDH